MLMTMRKEMSRCHLLLKPSGIHRHPRAALARGAQQPSACALLPPPADLFTHAACASCSTTSWIRSRHPALERSHWRRGSGGGGGGADGKRLCSHSRSATSTRSRINSLIVGATAWQSKELSERAGASSMAVCSGSRSAARMKD